MTRSDLPSDMDMARAASVSRQDKGPCRKATGRPTLGGKPVSKHHAGDACRIAKGGVVLTSSCTGAAGVEGVAKAEGPAWPGRPQSVHKLAVAGIRLYAILGVYRRPSNFDKMFRMLSQLKDSQPLKN